MTGFLVILGLFVFLSAFGFLAEFVDRKLCARLQNRVGPPWFQPVADFIKLSLHLPTPGADGRWAAGRASGALRLPTPGADTGWRGREGRFPARPAAHVSRLVA